MYTFLIVVYLIVCIALVAVILMQSGKGGGLSEALGGAFQSVFGPKATTVLVKATSVLAVLFILLSITLAKLSTGKSKSLMERIPEENTAEQF
ncbi:MAG: preprotein translocase subunit SecG [Candidatus Kaelpia imicola]|nr:preprotein translocase subunit SecG [Candidatus Kaelpia imicola]